MHDAFPDLYTTSSCGIPTALIVALQCAMCHGHSSISENLLDNFVMLAAKRMKKTH